jgi:tetratricopeptide (TPR) repeat protein
MNIRPPDSSPASAVARDGAGGWREWFVGAAIVVAAFLAYWPSLRGGFLWDDDGHVTGAALRSVDGLRRIWTEPGATQQYYPVLHTAFWAEHRLWGDAAAGYRLINLLLHLASACLLVRILRRLEIRGAWLAAAVFALHPVCVESVAWISEQKNTLSLFFYLAALLVYLRFDTGRARRHYGVALVLFALALGAKTVTATLPAALLVIFWWRRGRLEWRRDVVPLLPWFALSAVAGTFTAWMERNLIGASGTEFSLTFVQRGLVAGRALWFYVGKVFWPAELCFVYPRWRFETVEPRMFFFPVGVLAVFMALWAIRGRTRAPLAGALFFAGSLFPALGFVNVYPFLFSFVADHFQYLACLGVIVPVAGGLTAAWARWPAGWRTAGRGAAVAGLAALGVLTWQQSRLYVDASTLYTETLRRNPDCWMAAYNLGNLRLKQGELAAAVEFFDWTIALRPDDADAFTNRGAALRRLGRPEEAIASYREALRRAPDSFSAHYDLGGALAGTGRWEEAVVQFENACRIEPDHSGIQANLAAALLRLNRPTEAVPHFERALREQPDDVAVLCNLGIALRDSGRPADAVARFDEALHLKPDSAEVHYNLALALRLVGRPDEAREHYRTARRLKPDLPMIFGFEDGN